MEEQILWKIRGLLSPSFDFFFVFATYLGAWNVIYPAAALAGLALYMAGSRGQARLLWALVVTTGFLGEGLKYAVAAPRPELWPWLAEARGYAFPSGHSLAAATFYPVAAHLAGERLPKFRGLFYAGAAALAALVGLSRLVLGVHWPRDVLGGLALGVLQAALA